MLLEVTYAHDAVSYSITRPGHSISHSRQTVMSSIRLSLLFQLKRIARSQVCNHIWESGAGHLRHVPWDNAGRAVKVDILPDVNQM